MTSFLKKTAGWARQHKLKATACIAFSIASCNGAVLHYSNSATPDEASRGRQSRKLEADLDHLADADSAYHAVDDFKGLLYGRPGALTAPVDKDQLKAESDRLLGLRLSAQATLFDDLAISRDLSMNDLADFRVRAKMDLPDPRDDLGLTAEYFNNDIRKCQNRAIAKEGAKPSDEGAAAFRNCLEKDGREISGTTFLTLMVIWSSIAGAIPTAILMRRRSLRKRAAAQAAEAGDEPQEDAAAAPAAAPAAVPAPEPDPMVLSAPTKVSRPLTLKMKQSLARFPA